MLRDQRTMTGDDIHSSPESIAAFWNRWAAQKGFDRGTGLRSYELRHSGAVLVANVSEGRWVADCQAAGCGGGVALWRENPRACCLTCGTVYSRIDWPTDEEISDAEKLFLDVRDVTNQNWRRDRGETVETLRHENIMRGYSIVGSPGGDQPLYVPLLPAHER